MSSPRMPALYLPHGGGPWPFVPLGLPQGEVDALAAWLRALPGSLPQPPTAIVVVSAHWEADRVTVGAGAAPPLLFDYTGFPDAAYQLTWPAPGDPALAAHIADLLRAAGVSVATDADRGFDHAAFVPLKVAWPDAQVPTVQLSLRRDLDPAFHLSVGRALAPLRDEGVLLIGSGMSFHNLRAFFGRAPKPLDAARAFDGWLHDLAGLSPARRAAELLAWERAPGARISHPRAEHLLPLHVIAGAALTDPGVVSFSGTFAGLPITALTFGGAAPQEPT